MKYEVGKPYIHDGSAKCPLPEGSAATLIMSDGGYRHHTKVSSWFDWRNALCFVPTYIPPQPVERWAVYGHDGRFISSYLDKSMADTAAALRPDRRVVLLREVTE